MHNPKANGLSNQCPPAVWPDGHVPVPPCRSIRCPFAPPDRFDERRVMAETPPMALGHA